MNVGSPMCAPSGRAFHTDQIDWHRCQRQARRLQARIVKATGLNPREHRLRSRGALQRLEPCEGKLSCTVLRGGGGGNAASLPDQAFRALHSGSASSVRAELRFERIASRGRDDRHWIAPTPDD
jgi:hypothetical protein